MPRIKASDFEKTRNRSVKLDLVDAPEPIDQTSAVATIEPPKPEPPPRPLPASVARRNAEICDAEILLMRRQAGEVLDPREEEFIEWLWPKDADRNAERARVARLWKLRQAAATGAVREEAATKAAEAGDRLADEGQRLRDVIARAQADLAELERAAQQADAIAERHTTAVLALRDPTLLNDVDRGRYERLRRNWELHFGRPARTRRQEANACLERSAWTLPNDHEKIVMYIQSDRHLTPRGILSFNSEDRRYAKVHEPQWLQHAAELRARAERLTAEADRLETAGEPLRAELDAMLAALIPA